MDNTVYIDFSVVSDYTDFYNLLKEKADLPEYFADNLDALYDVISGYLKLPLTLEFVNMSVEQLELFEDLLITLEDAEEEVDDFYFTYFMLQYEDDEKEDIEEEEEE